MATLDTCNKIQDLIAGSALIVSAPHVEDWPPQLDDSQLPTALTRPAAASWVYDTMGQLSCHRQYVTDIYVLPVAAGAYAEGIVDALAVIDSVGAILGANPTLDGTVFEEVTPRDKGLVILTYGGVEYRGAQFTNDAIEGV